MVNTKSGYPKLYGRHKGCSFEHPFLTDNLCYLFILDSCQHDELQ